MPKEDAMAISVVDKAVALLVSLSSEDIASLPPAERRRLADQCRHIAKLAEPPNGAPNVGILADLRRGQRGE
jgi:hypothetical protein